MPINVVIIREDRKRSDALHQALKEIGDCTAVLVSCFIPDGWLSEPERKPLSHTPIHAVLVHYSDFKDDESKGDESPFLRLKKLASDGDTIFIPYSGVPPRRPGGRWKEVKTQPILVSLDSSADVERVAARFADQLYRHLAEGGPVPDICRDLWGPRFVTAAIGVELLKAIGDDELQEDPRLTERARKCLKEMRGGAVVDTASNIFGYPSDPAYQRDWLSSFLDGMPTPGGYSKALARARSTLGKPEAHGCIAATLSAAVEEGNEESCKLLASLVRVVAGLKTNPSEIENAHECIRQLCAPDGN